MDTQSIKENDETIGEPVAGEEPARDAPLEDSCDPNGDTRGGSEAQSDEGMSRDPSLGENLQTEEPDQCAANEECTCSRLQLSFPRKLWAIVENEAFKSVGWSEQGDTMKIEADLFETEVLHHRGSDKIFEMDSLKSFICQLNLHGFRKISTENSAVDSGEKEMMIYQNANFQRDKPELLENIGRRGDLHAPAQEDDSYKRSKLDCLRHSPRFQEEEEENTISLNEAPNDQEPKGQDTIIPTGVTGCPLAVCTPPEHSVPCGECTPEDGTMVSPASDKIEESGQGSSRSSRYPDWDSMLSFYNKCSSMLKSAMLAISLSDLSHGKREEDSTSESSDEEEEEAFRQNKCVICELFKGGSRS